MNDSLIREIFDMLTQLKKSDEILLARLNALIAAEECDTLADDLMEASGWHYDDVNGWEQDDAD